MGAPVVKTSDTGGKLPAGIARRGNRYIVRARVQGVPRWQSVRTLGDATKLKGIWQQEDQYLDAHDLGLHRIRPEEEHCPICAAAAKAAEQSAVKFQDYFRKWLDGYRRKGIRESTRTKYARQIETAIEYFPDDLLLVDLDPPMIRAYIGWLEDKGLQPASVRAIMAPLRIGLSQAVVDVPGINYSPAREIKVEEQEQEIIEDEDEVKHLTRSELDMFLRIVDPRWELFFTFLASTGLRISEAVGLEWRHVELDGSRPHVKVRQAIVKGVLGAPKTKNSRREVPLSHSLVIALRGLRTETEWPGDASPVFANGIGTTIDEANVRARILKPAAQEAGVPWAGFHAFRHSAASMLMAGKKHNVAQMAAFMGHTIPVFLSIYVHLMDDGVGAPIDLLVDDPIVRACTSGVDERDSAHALHTDASRTGDNADADELANLLQ